MSGSESKNQSSCSDEEILALLFSRNDEAIRALEQKYRTALLRLSARFLSDEGDREEVLQDVWMKVWNTIPPLEPASLPAFLITLTRRAAIDRLKKDTRQKAMPKEGFVPLEELSDVLGDARDPAQIVSSRELGQAMSRYLQRVSERQQYIFISRYYLSRPLNEICEKLHVSRSTVEKELAALRRGLREALRKEGYEV